MEIKFMYKNKVVKIELGSKNIILGLNSSGKSLFCDAINNGFKGNEDYFVVNGLDNIKGIFNVIYLDENRNSDLEVELKSGSIIQKEIIKKFLFNNEEELHFLSTEFTKNVTLLLEKECSTNYKFLLSESNLSTTTKKVSKLDSVIFDLLFKEKNSKSAKEEFLFMKNLNKLSADVHNVLVIDNIDQSLDFNTINHFFSQDELSNVTIICTSKNKYILNDVKFDFIYNSSLTKIELLEEAKLMLFKSLLKKEETNYTVDDYVLLNEELYLEKDYKNYLKKNLEKIINSLKI